MSKHLLEVLTSLTHMSLLETMGDGCGAAFDQTLDIQFVDQDEQGNTTHASDTRYVKVNDSQSGSQVYAMQLEEGYAHLCLEHITGVQVTIVQVDEQGHQVMNGVEQTVLYEVNGEVSEDDYARLYFSSQMAKQALRIINRPHQSATLQVSKIVYDEYHNVMDVQADMSFCVHLEGMGMKLCQTLDASNAFTFTWHALQPGRYTIYEDKQENYEISYSFNQGEFTTCSQFVLSPGEHSLDIANTRKPRSILTLDKYIRDQNGELMKPQDRDRFNVRVIGDYFDKDFELNCDNGFAMDICDLPNGYYDISEEDCGMYDISYLVNAEKECDYAHVEVRECESSAVMIINTPKMCCEQDSPLRICKYVRRSDGCIVKPDPCDAFKVMLSGCGVCETFNLNASNNFCVDIEHICCGEYEVRELANEDYLCSYIVNDECETTRAFIFVHEGGRNCVQIINEERNKGQVSICKVIRSSNGDYVKPDKDARFLVTLRSFFCRETFVLDASNDFCVHVANLKEGSYEVKEHRIDGFETRYRINGGKEERKARFLVENGSCCDVKIINRVKKEHSGDLRIVKFISNSYGDYVKPAADEEFEIHVEGPCLDACYVLKASNNWCIILEGLKKGVYRIEEASTSWYCSQYYVNGQEVAEALVCMDKENQDVEIVNTRRSFGNLKLAVVIQQCDGTTCKPRPSESFEVLIENSKCSRMVTLQADNNFCILLDDLEKGKYRITQKDSYGYKVSYDIDGDILHQAIVSMDGNNRSITILNQMMHCSGIVRVHKWIENECGDLVCPCPDEQYSFLLKSSCLENTYTLHAHNDFCVFFDDLEEGNYEVEEVCAPDMEVHYRINNEDRRDGTFYLGREDVDIDIINCRKPLPCLHVKKRMKVDGKLVLPQDQEQFDFILKGRGTHERFTLCKENHWSVCIEGLCNQHYEIKEIEQNCRTLYQMDDCLCDDGYFLFEEQDMEITIINEDYIEPIVEISKYVQTAQGDVEKPCRDERYEVIIEGACYKQCFLLRAENDWCVQLEGLPCGHYQIYEADRTSTPYITVDEQPCTDGSFDVYDQDIHITLINPESCANVLSVYAYEIQEGKRHLPSSYKEYQVAIEHDGQCDHFLLDEHNEWCIALADICPGTYQIRCMQEDMYFEVEHQRFAGCVEVDIQDNEVCVNLLDEHCASGGDIEICKRLYTTNGDTKRPMRDTIYEVMLSGPKSGHFELSEENDWKVVLNDYPNGDYEVKERYAKEDTRYQVDGGTPHAKGCFTLQNQSVSVVVFNAEKSTSSGALSIHALVKNCDGDVEYPPKDARFDVMIDGEQVQEDITLSERNGFLMRYDHLPAGAYTITQKENEQYERVTYRVNGVEQGSGNIVLGEEDIQVDVINYANCEQGSIRVMKYIKDESCGCLKRPCMEETYDIELHSSSFHQVVVLNSSNKWSYVFDHLANDTYTLKELHPQGDVTYIVNGGKESEKAEINMQGQEVNVKVINAASVPKPTGSIEICKLVKDEQGRYHYPPKDASYWVSVIGGGDTQRILLHSANHFFVDVRGLQDGMYEVVEEDGTNVSYTINGGKEQNQAKVQVQGDTTSVNVINATSTTASLTLRKYMQGEDGHLLPPDGDDAYRIHVSRPGFNKIVILDAQNNYTAVLEDLKQGLYVVDELDHEGVTYIIDGGTQVDRGVVRVVSDQHEVQIINPQKQHQGSMIMTKFIRNTQGQLVRPKGEVSYAFHISRPGFNKVVTLDKDNRWSMTLQGLEDGNYVISELDSETDVSYIINDGNETDFGIVNVQHNENRISIINAQKPSENGSITITKYMRNAQAELLRPTGDFQTRVHVSKPGYNEVFTLNQANDWTISLVDLMDGSYVLNEVASEDDVTWRINGGNEVRYGVVDVLHNENQVDMIDTPRSSGGSINLNKFIRNAQGQLVKPQQQERFTINLRGPSSQSIALDMSNNWNVTVDNLEDGLYQIREVTPTNYDVSYIVNDGSEETNAQVQVAGDSQQVRIINAVRGSRNVLEISKYMKTSNGSLIIPAEGDTFLVEVSGNQYQEVFTLDAQNRFTQRISNLTSGTYSVREMSIDDVTTTYRVNGGQETSSASISVSDGKNNIVEVINERRANQNSLDVYKYMMEADGSFVKPQPMQVFRFLLTGNNVHQFYTLSSANDWHVEIDQLSSGEYEVIEQSSAQYQVRYLVNGADFSETGEVTLSAGIQSIVEIVNTATAANHGTLQLEKKIRDASGSLVIPGNGESFQIRVVNQNQQYDELFILDELNGYSLTIEQLAYGMYEVMETENSGYGVTYIVNDGNEAGSAIVNIQSAQTQNVMIINTQLTAFYNVKNSTDIKIVID